MCTFFLSVVLVTTMIQFVCFIRTKTFLLFNQHRNSKWYVWKVGSSAFNLKTKMSSSSALKLTDFDRFYQYYFLQLGGSLAAKVALQAQQKLQVLLLKVRSAKLSKDWHWKNNQPRTSLPNVLSTWGFVAASPFNKTLSIEIGSSKLCIFCRYIKRKIISFYVVCECHSKFCRFGIKAVCFELQ